MGPEKSRAASQFEALSKTLDAWELSSLVRVKLGLDVDDSGRLVSPNQQAQTLGRKIPSKM